VSEELTEIDQGGGNQLLGRTLPDLDFLAAIFSALDILAIFSASLGDRERSKQQRMKPAGRQTHRPMDPFSYK
jgi:hypothetical protein